jgi:hypothetical protein
MIPEFKHCGDAEAVQPYVRLVHTHILDGPLSMLPINELKEEYMIGHNNEQKFDEFVKKVNINVDDDGNFECYIVIDESNTEHEVGTIFNNISIAAYPTIPDAYDHLKIQTLIPRSWARYLYGSQTINEKNNTSIIEKLQKIGIKMIKILVNKNNITAISTECNSIIINKYKVIEFIKLNPQIAFKLLEFDNESHYLSVSLYNTITNKSYIIKIKFYEEDTEESIKNRIKDYLLLDEKQVKIQNKLRGQILF